MNHEIRELNAEEITSVAGGYDDVPYCGTPVHHFPFPPRPMFGQLLMPTIVIGSGP